MSYPARFPPLLRLIAMKKLLAPKPLPGAGSFGLLVLRVLVGVALVLHGWWKVTHEGGPTGWMGQSATFEPWMLAVAAFSEVGGGALLALGLLTPLAALAVLGTMLGAVYHHISAGDPFVNLEGGRSWELAGTYAAVALLVLTIGPGMLSVDKFVFARKS